MSGAGGTCFSFRAWLDHFPRSTRSVILTACYGLGAALIAIAFQVVTNTVFHLGLFSLAKQSTTVFLAGSFVVTVGTGLLAGWMLHTFAREAAGSGIPQLKRAFWKDFGHVPARVLWVKFIAASLQIGGGSSLGREGPSVQLAGTVGSQLAGLLGEPKQRHRRGAATGAAAGLSAAFNTPLAAVTFVLEEIIGDLNSRLLGGVLLAAMIGALTVHAILGPQPAFSIAPVGEPTWRAYLLVPLVAVAAALVGAAFQSVSLGLRAFCRGRSSIPRWLWPALGAFVCWAIGAAVFIKTGRLAVFGLGYEDLSDALAGRMVWQLAALLLLTKFIATVACYGTGGCGGIFSPTLFFGAMTGLVVAGIGNLVMPLQTGGVVLLAIVGMSATLGAVVRAPVTGILIVFEMTHDFALVPPLMLAALIAHALSRRLMHENFYDALLTQDGLGIEHVTLPRDLRAWQDQPVIRFAAARPVIVDSLAPEALARLLDAHPFHRFPVVIDGRLAGILPRTEAAAALREKRAPELTEAITCNPDERVRAASARLVETSVGMIVIQETEDEPVRALFTLHDLLRAQITAAEHHDAMGE